MSLAQIVFSIALAVLGVGVYVVTVDNRRLVGSIMAIASVIAIGFCVPSLLREISSSPAFTKTVPLNQQPTFDLSEHAKADVKNLHIFGDVPRGLAHVTGSATFSMKGTTIVSGNLPVMLQFPAPTGELSKKTNAQLRTAVAAIETQLDAFCRKQESAFESLQNIGNGHAYKVRSEEIAEKESKDFHRLFAKKLLSLGSELVARTSSRRPRGPGQMEIRIGWDEALSGELSGDPRYVGDFLNWLVAKLPS